MLQSKQTYYFNVSAFLACYININKKVLHWTYVTYVSQSLIIKPLQMKIVGENNARSHSPDIVLVTVSDGKETKTLR